MLVGTANQPTIISEIMPVAMPVTRLQTDERTRMDAPKGTLPLTRSAAQPVEPPSTEDLTNVRGRGSNVQAVSAMADASQAMKNFAVSRDEYDQLVGQTLDGRYYIDKKIGEGGMGVVFAARHAVIERPLAIKVLKREVMRDSATIRRFEQEAKAASRIGHPNIVDVTDFGTTPTGMTYQVMEYVKGETLGAALRKSSPFPLVRTVRVATQIARALGAAHDKGIVHRDLKPENVFLLDRDKRPDFVKIVDFGIAKVLPVEGHTPGGPRLTRAGSVFGTPEYMAPEQAAGKNDIDGRVDIYALGVLLYEMTTGRVPHRGDTMVRTLAMQMLDPVEPPTKVRPDLAIAPELEAVIMKALAKKRDDRYQTMGALMAALEELQTPVGLSMTGSPVYALVPLPPGADGAAPLPPGASANGLPVTQSLHPNVPVPSTDPGTRGQSGPIPTPGGLGSRPSQRARNPTMKRVHEPEFVTTERPHTFEHVFADDTTPERTRRWPLMLLFALILGGAGGAIALVVKSRSRVTQSTPEVPVVVVADAASPVSVGTLDGGAVVVTTTDGGIAVAVVDGAVAMIDDAGAASDGLDAGSVAFAGDAGTVVIDGGSVAVINPHNGNGGNGGNRPRKRDAGVEEPTGPIVTPNGRGTYEIKVLTKPEGADLYVGGRYRGPGGTSIEMAAGTKTIVTCKLAGYKPGSVALVYDGQMEVRLCVLARDTLCVPDLKNPFDHCEDGT